jgi:thiamine biosynthesis protein ThiI
MMGMERVLVLKIAGEIGTKSARTRRRFLRTLTGNVRAALRRAGVRAEIEPRWSRLLVRAEDHEAAGAAVGRVFGLHSVSDSAVVRFSSLGDLVGAAADVYRDRVAGRTFAVRARRSGQHPFRSTDVAVALGDALRPVSSGVDLREPDVEVPLEIVEDTAYLFLERRPGAGGLPVGVGGRAVALFSGGFDSPVAAWMTMRRGMALELVTCDLGGCGQVDAALEVARGLVSEWAPGIEPRAHVVDLAPAVAVLRARIESGIRQVVLKRAMYRAATIVAERVGAEALVTGEALGQVSTQTVRNLAVAEDAAGLPVLRPLIGMDKEEILSRARDIGTHDASLRVQEHCDIASGRVETAARLRHVVNAEGRLDDWFVDDAARAAVEIDLTTWQPGPPPEHVLDALPEAAVVVDIREPEEGEPAAGDLRLPFSRVEEWVAGLEPGRTYVFVCTHGNRSEMVAHDLRRRGIDAYSLAGGIGRLPDRAA